MERGNGQQAGPGDARSSAPLILIVEWREDVPLNGDKDDDETGLT